MLDAITNYCDVVPSYGPSELPPQLTQLAALISHEEYAVLLASIEHQALLLTLDGRLRSLASMFQVPGIWPQAFLRSKLGAPLLHRDYAVAIFQMFCSRREFISLGADDLLVLTDQGRSWLNIGLTRLREQWASSNCDFKSAWAVTREYLVALGSRPHCQSGVVLEIFAYLLEGLIRNPQAPRTFGAEAAAQVAADLGLSSTVIESELSRFSKLAIKRLNAPLQPIFVRAQILFCSSPPAMLDGLGGGADPFVTQAKPAPVSAADTAAESTLNRSVDQ